MFIGVDHTWGPSYGSTLLWNSTRDKAEFMGINWPEHVTPWEVVEACDRDRFQDLFIKAFRGEKTEL